jgi:hypothetical protein
MILMFFLIPLDEHPGDNFIQGYWHILSDPAHLAVEVTLTILLDVVLLGMFWPMIKTYINSRLARQHEQLDAEHGISHHGDHIHRDPVDVPEDACEDPSTIE